MGRSSSDSVQRQVSLGWVAENGRWKRCMMGSSYTPDGRRDGDAKRCVAVEPIFGAVQLRACPLARGRRVLCDGLDDWTSCDGDFSRCCCCMHASAHEKLRWKRGDVAWLGLWSLARLLLEETRIDTCWQSRGHRVVSCSFNTHKLELELN